MTDRPESLAAALAELQQHLPRIGKDAQGQYGKYGSLAAVSREILPMLGELGLAFTARPTTAGDRFRLHYTLWHVSGDRLDGSYPLPASGSPQQIGSAITYARRYCLCAVTGAVADEDDDAESAEQEYRALRRQPPEVREDGSATEAEQARMVTGPEPGVERLGTTPVDESWYDQPARTELPEEQPGSSLPGQRQDIYIAMSKRDIVTPEARREALERLVGRPLLAAKQLSFNEAVMVLARVNTWDGRTESLLAPLAVDRSKADA